MVSTEEFERHRQFILERIRMIQREHQAQLKPWLDRLVELESLGPLKPITLRIDQIPQHLKETLCPPSSLQP